MIRLDGSLAFELTPEGRRILATAEIALKLERVQLQLRDHQRELRQLDGRECLACPDCERELDGASRDAFRARLIDAIDALRVDRRYYEQRLEQLRAGDDAGVLKVPRRRATRTREKTAAAGPVVHADPARADEITAAKRAYWSETGTTGGTTDRSFSRRAIPRYSALSQG